MALSARKWAPGFCAINKVNVYQTEGRSCHFEPGTDQLLITEKMCTDKSFHFY